ncbi:MAG: hypothetical protein ACI8PZ_000757 [Myxococcota bacterium]|jgi:hypothetical protein
MWLWLGSVALAVPVVEGGPVVRGEPLDLVLSGLAPGEPVALGASVAGPGVGPCLPDDPSVCLALVRPVKVAAAVADGAGQAAVRLVVPSALTTDPVWLQAVGLGGSGAGTVRELEVLPPEPDAALGELWRVHAERYAEGSRLEAAAAAGDVNGDGWADLVIGQRGFGGDRGKAHVVFGPLVGDVDLYDDDRSLMEDEAGAAHGAAVLGPGDLDGDGYDDVVIGAPLSSESGAFESGRVTVWAGPLPTDHIFGDMLADLATGRLLGDGEGDEAGSTLATAGDLTGDGLADLWVGAPFHDVAVRWEGAVYLVAGPVEGTSDLADAAAVLTGVDEAERAGTVIAGGHDISGDGVADLVVGAAPWSTNRGRVFVVTSVAPGVSSLDGASGVWSGEAEGDFAGGAVSVGPDVDGDGLGDVLAGARFADGAFHSGGRAYLLPGPASGAGSMADGAVAIVDGLERAGGAGQSVAITEDMTGDGWPDVWVGTQPSAGDSRYTAGAACLVPGPVAGVLDLADAWCWVGEAYSDDAASQISGVPDLTGDGRSDVLVLAPDHATPWALGYLEGVNDGAAYVIPGGL